jgi:hypothetical protein
MWMNRAITWSPCEIDYLKSNRETRSINELSLYLAKSRNAIKNKLDELDGKAQPKKKNKISRIGKRDDIVQNGKAQFFRSSWEANVARWFNSRGRKWTYEPKVFFFEKVKHGTVSYCPDFLSDDEWIEIKGMLDGHSQTALRRFQKYYPEEFKKLKAVVGRPNTKADKFFKKLGVPILAYISDLDKEFGKQIPGWE